MTKNIEHAILLHNEASLAEEQGNVERAEMLYMESRRIFEHAGGIHRLDAANIMNAIAFMKQNIEDHNGVLAAAQEALKVVGPVRYTESGGDESEIRLQAWSLIGNTYRHQARYDEAEQILQKALAYAVSIYGEESEQASAARKHLGILYKYAGKFEQGEKLYRNALKNLTAKHGELHSAVAVLYHNLGGLFYARGDYEEAEKLFQRALEIKETILGYDHPDTALTANNLGVLLQSLGRKEDARKLFQRAAGLYGAAGRGPSLCCNGT